jgi:hypothetical protein
MILLNVVQNVMSSLSLEEVNSIEEVPESVQIAEIVKETYYEVIAHREWEFLRETFSLTASGDNNKPVLMTMPKNVTDLQTVRYFNTEKDVYEEVEYLSPEEFLELNSGVKLSDDVEQYTDLVKQVDAVIRVKNNKQPEYYTSFDEENVIFDSYNSAYDTTLQSSKTLCYGSKRPVFIIEDDYEIDMPEEMIWSYLLPEVKSVASINLLQTSNAKEEQRSRRGRFRMYHAHPKTTDSYRRSVAKFGRK